MQILAWVVRVNRVIRGGLIQKVAFEQRIRLLRVLFSTQPHKCLGHPDISFSLVAFLLGATVCPSQHQVLWRSVCSCCPGTSLGHYSELDYLFPSSHIFLLLGSCSLMMEQILQQLPEKRYMKGEKVSRMWVSQRALNLPLQLIESLAHFGILGWKPFLLEFSRPQCLQDSSISVEEHDAHDSELVIYDLFFFSENFQDFPLYADILQFFMMIGQDLRGEGVFNLLCLVLSEPSHSSVLGNFLMLLLWQLS